MTRIDICVGVLTLTGDVKEVKGRGKSGKSYSKVNASIGGVSRQLFGDFMVERGRELAGSTVVCISRVRVGDEYTNYDIIGLESAD